MRASTKGHLLQPTADFFCDVHHTSSNALAAHPTAGALHPGCAAGTHAAARVRPGNAGIPEFPGGPGRAKGGRVRKWESALCADEPSCLGGFLAVEPDLGDRAGVAA